MRVGEYFGEISLIYSCKTTARITARKYCNFATLTKKIFGEVCMQFTGIQDAIQQNIYKYNDKLIRFIRKGLLKIPYFEKCSLRLCSISFSTWRRKATPKTWSFRT